MFVKYRFLMVLCFISTTLFNSHLHAATAQCKKDFTGELQDICMKAIKDDPEAQLQISRYYAGQIDPSVINYPQAFYWHRRLARLAVHLNLGEPVYSETMYNTGVFYADGLGVEQDYNKAFYWFKKAADRGDDIAMFRLAMIYSEGLGIVKDLNESLNWLKRAVVAGNLDAKILLAQVYSEGQLVPQNNSLAIKLLREAVEQNSASANFALGNFYLHGIEVEKSRVMAKNLFGSACRANLLEACRAYYDIDVQEAEPSRLTPSESPIE